MTLPFLIACDPGPLESALVVVVPASRGRIAVVRSTMMSSTFKAFEDFFRAQHEMPCAVAIERAEGFAFAPYRVPGLLAANEVAGELSGLAKARGVAVLKAPAEAWRKAVIGPLKRGQKYDELIEHALPTWVIGAVVGNEHQRDACGLALWASRIVWKVRAA